MRTAASRLPEYVTVMHSVDESPGFMPDTEYIALAPSSSVRITVPADQLLARLSVVSLKAAEEARTMSTDTRSSARMAAPRYNNADFLEYTSFMLITNLNPVTYGRTAQDG
jgi:hypothetical protein